MMETQAAPSTTPSPTPNSCQVLASNTPSASQHQPLHAPGGLYNRRVLPAPPLKTSVSTSLAIPPTTIPSQPLTALQPGVSAAFAAVSPPPPHCQSSAAGLDPLSRQTANKARLAERKRKRAAAAAAAAAPAGLNAAAAPKRFDSPTASNIAPPHSQSMPYRQYRAKPSHGQGGDSVWDEELEAAFMDAVRKIPKIGRRKLPLEGKPCGRNELIAEYIFKVTGKRRTRKQVSSHIQVLKNLLRHDEAFMKCVTTDDISSSWETENTTFDIDSMGSPSAFSEPTPTLPSRPLSHFSPLPPLLRPVTFEMWVATTSASGAMEGCYHTYTRLSPHSPPPIPLSSIPAWQSRFPHLADVISASELTPDTAVLHISTTVAPLTSMPPSRSLLCTQLEITVSHAPPSTGSSWECTTRIYAPSKKVLELTSSVSQAADGRLTLPFASDFWGAFYTGLGGASPREVGKTLDGITVVQELWEGGKRVAVLCWEFAKAQQGREGGSVWRDVAVAAEQMPLVAADHWQPLSPYDGYYGFEESGGAMLAAVDMSCAWNHPQFPAYGIAYHATSQPEDWAQHHHHLSPVSDGGVSVVTTANGF